MVFDCDYEAPIDTMLEISGLHPELTFTLSYTIPGDETVGILEVKNDEISNEEDDIYSDLVREILGDEYVDEL